MLLTIYLHAFDAPLLQGVSCNHNGNKIAKFDGKPEIQYGILANEVEVNKGMGQRAEKFVIADRERVNKPTRQRWGRRGCREELRSKPK